jgi:hypothetical protein
LLFRAWGIKGYLDFHSLVLRWHADEQNINIKGFMFISSFFGAIAGDSNLILNDFELEVRDIRPFAGCWRLNIWRPREQHLVDGLLLEYHYI